MKLARHATIELRNDERAMSAMGASSTSSNQLALVSSAPPRSGKSTSHTRALSRKTRTAVEAWIEKLFVSDKERQQRQPTRRASTGSLLASSSSTTTSSLSTGQQTKRRSSLFTRSNKENSSSAGNAKNTKKKPSKGKLSKSKSKTSKDSDAALWLQPVASLPQFECENSSPFDVINSSSHFKVANGSSQAAAAGKHKEAELIPAYVTPPVEMPPTYRTQDRRGGMIVSGRTVLFTNAAFKRKLRNLSKLLREIPEHRPAQMHESHLSVYLSALSYVDPSDPLASSYGDANGDDKDDEIVPLSQWI